jgi:RNA polymerase sigma-70 factor, ECF subfamily
MAVELDRWEGVGERSRDEAFAELYESSYPSLVKYCRGLLGDGADPEGVAQEAFLRAWTAWDRYSSSRPFWALVATIARNLCMDHHRHARVVADVLEQRAGELTSTPGITPEERLEQDEEYEWARQAMAELCPSHQRIISLREIEGWSADDLAAADGTTTEAATAALYRARQRLRDAYNRVAAGALGGLAYFPLRGMRRRIGLFAHYTSQAAVTSPGLVSHAGDAIAAVVAIAIVSGAPVVNPVPQPALPDRPAAVVAETGAGAGTAGAPVVRAADAAAGASNNQATAAKPAASPSPAPIAGTTVSGLPDTVTVAALTAAPFGSSAHDVYAAGTTTQGCPATSSNAPAPCPVLFHSPDGGVTWEHLKGAGFSGGTVLLAPNFSVDRSIFVSGPNGLQVSRDNGATFSTLVPLTGSTAVSPAFAFDHRILIGAMPGWEYRNDANTTTPLHLQNRPAGQALSFAFSSMYAKDGRVYVGSSAPSGSDPTQQSVAVTVCAFSTCGNPVALPGAQGLPTILPARTFAANGEVLARTAGQLFRSTDGGHSFKAVTLPANGAIAAIAEDPDGGIYVSLLTASPKTNVVTGGVYVTRDGGKTWTPVGEDSSLAKGATSISSLGRDRLLASPVGAGLLCSTDAGKTWAKRCSAIQ